VINGAFGGFEAEIAAAERRQRASEREYRRKAEQLRLSEAGGRTELAASTRTARVVYSRLAGHLAGLEIWMHRRGLIDVDHGASW